MRAIRRSLIRFVRLVVRCSWLCSYKWPWLALLSYTSGFEGTARPVWMAAGGLSKCPAGGTETRQNTTINPQWAHPGS
ncbi:hypothetical protein GGR56DRAFT_650568 [Xylariaceae sp. FL0804]|nr:hypothetical protein GGR56DRAFT_650568 [Xylariaceae sp. FL0804]